MNRYFSGIDIFKQIDIKSFISPNEISSSLVLNLKIDQIVSKSPDVEAQEKIELTAGETEDDVIIKNEN